MTTSRAVGSSELAIALNLLLNGPQDEEVVAHHKKRARDVLDRYYYHAIRCSYGCNKNTCPE